MAMKQQKPRGARVNVLVTATWAVGIELSTFSADMHFAQWNQGETT